VFRTLEDRWPIGDIIFGTAFFTIAQILLFAFSAKICDVTKHYIDGLFFFSLCMLLSVMVVYMYWDSITARRVCALLPHIWSHPWFAVSGRISSSPSAPKRPMGGTRPAAPLPVALHRSRLSSSTWQPRVYNETVEVWVWCVRHGGYGCGVELCDPSHTLTRVTSEVTTCQER
jgi:hypothetical protein